MGEVVSSFGLGFLIGIQVGWGFMSNKDRIKVLAAVGFIEFEFQC
jgi:hypothetical protein